MWRTDCLSSYRLSLSLGCISWRADFAALTGSTVSRRRQISRPDDAGLEGEREGAEADAGFLAGSNPPAVFWCRLYLSPPPPRFRCPLLPVLFLSFLLPPPPPRFPSRRAKNQRVCAHRDPWNKRARQIEEVERVGFIYAGRQVGKDTRRLRRRQPVLPFCASAASRDG